MTDRAAVIAVAQGVDVIVHAVHPLYPDWTEVMPLHTANVIAAGLASGAKVMISGNVYTFGEHDKTYLNEAEAPAPTSKKGALRLMMERAFEAAAEQGLRTVILRGGDFIERENTGDWFAAHITGKVPKGAFTYPGPMDAVHAWAYLPDMARAMAELAAKRGTLSAYSSFGFEGYSLTGTELKAAVENAVGRKLKLKFFPWFLLRPLGVFSPLLREVIEMRYLWDTPHRVDGAALAAVLPDFNPTPLEVAMKQVLSN